MKTQKIFSLVGGLVAIGLAFQMPVLQAQEARFFRILGPVTATITAIAADGTITWTNAPTNAVFTVQSMTSLTDSNWVDYAQVPATDATTSLRLFDPNPPHGMTLIPGGSFTRGDFFDDHISLSEKPLNTVQISPFYMDKYEVTKALWDEVYHWATNNGYVFYSGSGQGKATNHPVQSVSWLDAAVWCNARSEKEGLQPCYYTNVFVYRSIPYHPTDVNWSANGYRLPTEAEWEKAARGGAGGMRFPWNNTNTISHAQANYRSLAIYDYDLSGPSNTYHPFFNDGILPYTSPVGHFAPNGYGLYDMAGNVQELCWDYYSGSYYQAFTNVVYPNYLVDPKGPNFSFPSVTLKIVRGGDWLGEPRFCTVSMRNVISEATQAFQMGFRTVRAAGP